MEKILLLQNRHWEKERYPGLIQRDIVTTLIKRLSMKEVQVLLGVRRGGKSSVFRLLINHLIEDVDPLQILYINLDDPFFSDVWNDPKLLYAVIETAERLTDSQPAYLFIDEIQNVRGWERFIKSIYDTGQFKKIFITGSNSSLLKGTYARLLSGRYIADYVFPFSFREILDYNGIVTYKDLLANSPKVLRLLDDMLRYGSFPEVWKTGDPALKRDLLVNYYETIILKDCIANNAIRDVRTFKELAFYMVSNIGGMYSYNSLARSINSNENTVKGFINIIEDSFLFTEIKNFSYKLKMQATGKKKCYCVDNGLINAVSFMFSENRGRLFENLVFTEFLKNGYKDIYFFHNKKECDFIIKKERQMMAVQVVYEINSQNRKRELDGLSSAMERFNIPRGYIITFNQEEKISKDITIMPFWKIYKEILKR